LADIENAQL